MLRIELLGPLRILVQGRPLPANVWDRRNTRSLLGLLLTDPGKSFSFDDMMEAVWPHLDPDAAAKSLRAAVSKLRKVLEPDLPQGRLSKYIRTDPMGYSFTVPPHCILDVDEV
ncbi:MAG: winged helix-turn-helix domain-containing protein, partial [Nitrospirae bacterium]|nr:winged helix-turn-helix domain-containing protein [Nitrospirota bacterium]